MSDKPAEDLIRARSPEAIGGDVSPVLFEEVRKVPATRARRAARLVVSFVVGQGAAQGLTLLINLLLVRLLTVDSYAQLGIVTGFQGVFGILMDMGFAATIIPLVGARGRDRAVVGHYVRSARRLRDQAFWILAPLACVSFLAAVHKHHWSLTLQLFLLGTILLRLYSAGMVSFFAAPLFLLGRLRDYYVPQVVAGATRLLACVALFFAGGLNAASASLLAALNVTFNGILIRKASLRHIDWPKSNDPNIDREFLRYVLPATPAMIFSAFQSQIALFLISIFGGTLYIAQVAALSRIGQLFTVAMTFNTIVIEPHIARLSREKLLRSFVGFALLACLASAPVVAIAFLWPGAYLWLLGSKYQGLAPVLGWYVLSCCLNFIAGLLWIMNRARNWVFWSGSILEVGLLLVVQIAFFVVAGVRTTQEAVNFSLASSGCYLIAHGYVTVRGFTQRVREFA